MSESPRSTSATAPSRPTPAAEVFGDGTVAGTSVAAVPFDEIVRDATDYGRKRVSILKIDCEGSEFPILLTSRTLNLVDTILRRVPRVQLAQLPRADPGAGPRPWLRPLHHGRADTRPRAPGLLGHRQAVPQLAAWHLLGTPHPGGSLRPALPQQGGARWSAVDDQRLTPLTLPASRNSLPLLGEGRERVRTITDPQPRSFPPRPHRGRGSGAPHAQARGQGTISSCAISVVINTYNRGHEPAAAPSTPCAARPTTTSRSSSSTARPPTTPTPLLAEFAGRLRVGALPRGPPLEVAQRRHRRRRRRRRRLPRRRRRPRAVLARATAGRLRRRATSAASAASCTTTPAAGCSTATPSATGSATPTSTSTSRPSTAVRLPGADPFAYLQGDQLPASAATAWSRSAASTRRSSTTSTRPTSACGSSTAADHPVRRRRVRPSPVPAQPPPAPNKSTSVTRSPSSRTSSTSP